LTWINGNRPGAQIISGGKSGNHAVKRFLALTAVLFLLLRPMCDVWGAAHGHADPDASVHAAAVEDGLGASGQPSEFCCAKAQDGNLISTGGIGIANAAFDSWPPFSTASVPVARASRQDLRSRSSRDAPPPQLSYYARSSRILR